MRLCDHAEDNQRVAKCHRDPAIEFPLLLLPAVFPVELGLMAQQSPAEPAAEVRIKSSKDGTQQPALFYVPPGAAATDRGSPVPLLVFLHSWSNDYKTTGGVAEALGECRRRGCGVSVARFPRSERPPRGMRFRSGGGRRAGQRQLCETAGACWTRSVSTCWGVRGADTWRWWMAEERAPEDVGGSVGMGADRRSGCLVLSSPKRLSSQVTSR